MNRISDTAALEDRAAYFRKVGRHDRAIGELPARERLQRLASGLWGVVLDEDLADAVGLPAAAAGTGNLDFENRAVFFAFLFDVLDDFCGLVSLR